VSLLYSILSAGCDHGCLVLGEGQAAGSALLSLLAANLLCAARVLHII
jgi:hypothetical protein